MSVNYFVDSLIHHESEELATNAYFTEMGPSPFLAADYSQVSSCSFASKNAVFQSSWDPVHSQNSVFYHAKHPYVGADSRFLRPWIEPASLAGGGSGSSRDDDLKSDEFPQIRHKEQSDYYNKASNQRIQQICPPTDSDPSRKIKEDQPELDPIFRTVSCLRKLWKKRPSE